MNSRNSPRGVIEPLEARIAPASLATFTDSDGDRFTVKVTGQGSATVTLVDPDGDTHGSIATLVLSGTNAKSALSIAVTKAAAGNGYVDLGQVTGTAVGSFVAAKSDLTGGLAFTGTVTSLQLHDVLNGADLTFGGTATAAVTLHLNAVGNGTAISSGERLASLTAKSVGVGTISAPALGPLKTTGGGFFSDLTTPGAVGAISVTGGGVSGHWDALRFGAITVTGGDFTAAVNATETAALLKTTAAIGAVTITGGNLHDTTLHALGGLTSLTVRKNAAHAGGGIANVTVDALRVGTLSVAADFDHSVLLAGANLGSDHALGGLGTAADTFAAARITKVSIAGVVKNGIIGAGFRSDDGVYKDGDDTIVGGTKSGITSFFVGPADAQSYFAGGTFPATVKIGTATVKPKLDARFLVIGGLDAFGPTLTAHLSNDTGASATDGDTSNAGISGTASDLNGVTQVQAGLDATPVGSFSSVPLVAGQFALTDAQVRALAGGTLADGAHTLHLRATDVRGNVGTFDVVFTLDTAVGASAAGLSLGSDTDTVGDGSTSAAKVTLAGTTDPGASVSMGGISTTANAAGAFQFSNVTLAAGANPFSFHIVDRAGNGADLPVSVTRTGASANGDVVLTWNQNTLLAIQADASLPTNASRTLAMESAAVFDVVNALEGVSGFFVHATAPAGASLEAAVAAAAARVLTGIYPTQAATFAGELSSTLSGLTAGQSVNDGVTLGQTVGDAIVALRANDHSADFVDYTPGTGPGAWQPTGPGFLPAIQPNWPSVTPFAIDDPNNYLPPGPPALDSAQWAADFNQTKSLGQDTSTTRTADQSQIARFWSDGQGTYTPAGHWNQIAQKAALAAGDSVSANARLFVELNSAMADAGIVAWDAKFTYEFWRPSTAIQNADTDGNAATVKDANWQPFLGTPAFPEYVSGHSTFGGAAATVLDSVFGNSVSFSLTSTGLPNVTRSYASFDAAADEAGMSRIYGGIHFMTSNLDGQAAGRSVGAAVLSAFAGVDTQAPRIDLDPFAADAKTSPTLTGHVVDSVSGVATFQAQIDAGAKVNVAFNAQTGAFSLPVGSVGEGLHHVKLFSSDAVGNAAAPLDLTFRVDTLAPVFNVSSPAIAGAITPGMHLTGAVDATGSRLVALSYAFDSGTPMTVGFLPSTGAFDQPLDVGALTMGAHTLHLSATDAAGNTTTQNLSLSLAASLPLSVSEFAPLINASEIGVTLHPKITFSRPVDVATLTNTHFHASSSGQDLPITIVPATDGTSATIFFDSPMPGGATIEITVDGDQIHTADGQVLDGDQNGTPGGTLHRTYRTVSTTGVAGTSIAGTIADPGPDLVPHTFDDVRAGPDGIINNADDIFKLPLQHVKVFVLGQEGQAVFTDAQGHFTLDPVPTGDVKLVIQGGTAINTPTGVYFPEMVMDLNSIAGQVNWAMPEMPWFYLPRIPTDVLHPIDANAPTHVGLETAAALDLTPAQAAMVSLTAQPGTAMGADGHPMANAQLGISAVPNDFVREMLPNGVNDLPFSFTVQAPGVAVFTTPVALTIPNLAGSQPGTKEVLISYDHATGLMAIEGTGTVSADGRTIVSDPGNGITHPGWHFFAPPPPPPPPPPPDDPDSSCVGDAESIPPTQPGNPEYVSLNFPNLTNNLTIRLRSDDGGHFETIMPANQAYHLIIYDPGSGLVATADGTSPGPGVRFNLVQGLTLHPSTKPDSDGDGLPDDAEFAIGTRTDLRDTDGDGISDFTEVKQGLNPLSNRQTTVGIVGALTFHGPAKEIAVTGREFSAASLTGYVATGLYGLAIVDLSQPDRPVTFSELDLPGNSTDVAADALAHIAVVASNTGGLSFIDTHDPVHPTIFRTLNVNAAQVEIIDGVVYAAVGGTVSSFDEFTGEALQDLPLPGGALIVGLTHEGRTLYSSDNGNVLRTIDTSGFAMSLHGVLQMDNSGKISAANGVLYGGAPGRGGYETVDVSDLDHPALISGSDIVAPNILPKTSIVTNGSGLGVLVGETNGVGSWALMDTSNPQNTYVLVGGGFLPSVADSVTIANGLGLIADDLGGLQVINYRYFDTLGIAPTVSITSHVADVDLNTAGIQVVEGTSIPLSVLATDDVQVRNVELLVNGQVVASSLSAPFDLSAIAPRIAAGATTATVQVRAIDTGGNFALSNTLTYHLVADTVAPVVTGTSPSRVGFDVTTMSLRFNEALDPAALSLGGITLTNLGADGALGGGDDTMVTLDSARVQGSHALIVSTAAPLSPGKYRLSVGAAVISDIAGNHPAGATTLTFTNYHDDPNADVWATDASGNWNDPSNWSRSVVPGPTDPVIIDRVGATPTITYASGNAAIKSLHTTDPLVLAGGSLEVLQSASLIAGPLTLSGGSLQVNGAGASLKITGATTLGGGALIAEGGGALEWDIATFPTTGATTFLRADPGSSISLPNLVTLHGASSGFVSLVANGGTVTAPALTSIPDGAAQLRADGTGLLDLSALATFTDTAGFPSTLEAHSGGTLVIPHLLVPQNVGILLDGATSQMNTTQFTNLDSDDLYAENGATLNLPGLINRGAVGFSTTMQADSGGTINLPNLTTFHGASSGLAALLALGGSINVPALTALPDGAAILRADGAGAVLDASALATFADNTGYTSSLIAFNGGHLKIPSLTAPAFVQIVLSGAASQMNTAQFTNLDTDDVYAQNGATMSLPGLINRGAVGFSTTLQADSGGTINLPNLTTLHGASSGLAALLALGGTINVPALTSMPDGAAILKADGAGAVLDVSALATFADNTGYTSTLQALNGGNLKIPSLTAPAFVQIVLSGAASQMNTAQFTNLDTDDVYAQNGATMNLSGLINRGAVGFSTTMQADSGGTINLPNLTTLHGASNGTAFVQALGGTINVPALTSMPDGAAILRADGAGSVLDASALATFADNTGYTSALNAFNGGNLKIPSLTAPTFVDIVLSGAGSQMNTAQFTNLDTDDVYAQNGATLNLPGLTSRGAVGFSTTLQADTGGTLNLPNLTTLHGASDGLVFVQAFGGTVNLPALTSIPDGAVALHADGAGAVLDASALTTFTDSTGYTSTLAASSGGNLKIPNLPAPAFVQIVLSGATSQMNSAQFTNLNTDDLFVQNGATMSLPGMVSRAAVGFSTTFQADSGGTLNLPNLTTFHGASLGIASLLAIGGTISAPALTSIPDGAADLRADGAGGVLDASALTTFTDSTGYTSTLEARNGGNLKIPSLAAPANVQIALDAVGSQMNTAQFTNLDADDVFVQHGATLNLPGLVSRGAVGFSTTFQADTGGTLNLPNLTTLHGATTGDVYLLAYGGTINAPALTSIPDGAATVQADGATGLVKLPALATFTDTSIYTSTLQSTNGGALQLTGGTLTLSSVDVGIAGSLSVGTLALATGTRLYGGGTITGNLLNSAGEVHPGPASGVGVLTITGNFTQSAAGSLFIEIGGLTVGTGFDRLAIGGQAFLNGTLALSLVNSFVPSLGDTFPFLLYTSHTGTFSTVTGTAIAAGKQFAVSYAAADVLLTVTP